MSHCLSNLHLFGISLLQSLVCVCVCVCGEINSGISGMESSLSVPHIKVRSSDLPLFTPAVCVWTGEWNGCSFVIYGVLGNLDDQGLNLLAY